jgi:triosephosphate isomerase
VARPCFVANWKMNKTVEESISYIRLFQEQRTTLSIQNCDLILAPPYTALFSIWKIISGFSRPIGLAAQNLYYEADGPYTGEISARMLCEIGCQYVIIGHSERRIHFGETDFSVAAKVHAAISAGLTPILCVGESAKEREDGKTIEVVQRQVKEGFCKIEGDLSHCIVAYEPIWAIGTGKTPTPSELEQVHQKIAQSVRGPRVIYGGSVNEGNVAAFMKEPHVDGMLVGGASLSAETFLNIIQVGIQ